MNIQNNAGLLRQSGFAIASLVATAASVLLFLLSIYVSRDGQDTNNTGLILGIAGKLSLVAGLSLGYSGIAQIDRRRRLEVIAVVINLVLCIILVVAVIYGLSTAGAP